MEKWRRDEVSNPSSVRKGGDLIGAGIGWNVVVTISSDGESARFECNPICLFETLIPAIDYSSSHPGEKCRVDGNFGSDHNYIVQQGGGVHLYFFDEATRNFVVFSDRMEDFVRAVFLFWEEFSSELKFRISNFRNNNEFVELDDVLRGLRAKKRGASTSSEPASQQLE